MAAYAKYENFVEDLAKKVHNLHADTLNIALSNTTPNVATHGVKADIVEIAGGNGYTAGGHDTQNTVSRTGGTVSVVGVDVVITASGAVPAFRYAILLNDTPTSPADPLLGHWDYASSITLAAAETFTIDFSTSMLTLA